MKHYLKQTQQYADYSAGAMEIGDHSKNGVSPKSLTSRMNFLLVCLLLPISLSAQVKLAESKVAKPELPEWWEVKDIIFAPYDSSYYQIKQTYPSLEAHKKYIGQQLYCPLYDINDINTFNYSNKIVGNSNTHLGNKHVGNKYYTIIDVLSINGQQADNIYGEISRSDRYQSGNYQAIHGGHVYYVDKDSVPCYVLKETESGDIFYTGFPENFLLVGGFVKIQQEFIGQNFIEYTNAAGVYKKWKCTDVVLTTDAMVDREYYGLGFPFRIILVFQNADDPEKIIERDHRRQNNIGRWVTEIAHNEMQEKILAGEAARERAKKEKEQQEAKEIAAHRQQLAQKEAQRKQELTAKYGAATATKILAGKYEIGMSKAVCKEIAGYAAVIDKTATTETWKISNIWVEYATYLYFNGDKLARIVNY
ncbi:MAG: cell envelope integrity protein TolA [Prevotellaceae bacterium]|jgi:hypothetical protein|nr:cell envelope integrity protein TolA [Prevotellaceae bacterium]